MSSALVAKDQDKRDSASESDEVLIMSVSERESPLQTSEAPKKKSAVENRIQYTRDELISYKESEFSKKWPDYLDPLFNNSRGVWDPERWHLNRKHLETPPDDDRGGRGDMGMEPHKRRSGDPRERLRKEQDGIVLSPQRRSFNSGCFVTLSQNSSRRPESPLSKSDRERDIGHRDAPSRRIGSGRIPSRDMWDFRSDREKDPDSDLFFQRGGSGSRERGDDRFERRSFGRDFERNKDRHRNDERPRYGDRRRALSDSREEEPEWLSGGPTSQHDTIELRGFEDIPEEQVGPRGNSKTKSNQNKSKSSMRSAPGSRKLSDPTPPQSGNSSNNDSGISSSGPGGRSTPTPTSTLIVPVPASRSPVIREPSESPVKPEPAKSPIPTLLDTNCWSDKPDDGNPPDFNIEYFLKGDSIPGLLTNGTSSEGTGGSRFSQWFHRDSPVNQEPDSRRSSLHDEMLNNIIDERTIEIPSLSDSDTYFAPISPAANTASAIGTGAGSGRVANSDVGGNTTSAGNVGVKNLQLLEMLQRGGQGDAAIAPGIKPQSIRDLEAAGKVTSVEELEARMRQGLNTPQHSVKGTSKKTDEDLTAFNKLMLSKSQEASVRQASRSAAEPGLNPLGGFGSLGPQAGGGGAAPQHPPPQLPTQQQMQIPQDLVMKLLQVQQQQQQQQQRQQQQQEMLTKLLAAGQQQQQQSQSASRLGFMPPPPSLSPLPPELQLMVNNAQPSRELLQRPEAQAILQGLKFGEITPQHLVQQLQNPAMQHRHREVLVSILKMQMQMQQAGISPRATSPHPHVQQPDLLHQMMLQQQQQQHQQQQLRIPSPLNSAYCQPPPVISPNLATNPNTLTVQHPVLPRVPSPRELIAHTQHIMQSALIKKKLEEQRENYRKRQEMQQSLSPNVPNSIANSNSSGKLDSSSPAKHHSSPTPLAFTPTSVLRKMTAEKESESGVNANRSEAKTTGSAIEQMKAQALTSQASLLRQTSVAPPLRPQPSTSVTWSMPKQHQQGRPIVKGNANFQYGPSVDYQQQQQMQQQQQRHNSMMGSMSGGYTNNIPRSKMTMPTPPPNMSTMPQQYNSMMMMQHRPPTMNPPSNTRAPSLQAHLASFQQQQQQQQNQQRNLQPSLQQLLLSQNYNTGRNVGKSDSRIGGSMRQHSQPMPVRHGQNPNMMGTKDLSTSPTSNQLARWFSPELLAQARAGQLPDMPPIPSTQNMLSLEELERLQQNSAVVHN